MRIEWLQNNYGEIQRNFGARMRPRELSKNPCYLHRLRHANGCRVVNSVPYSASWTQPLLVWFLFISSGKSAGLHFLPTVRGSCESWDWFDLYLEPRIDCNNTAFLWFFLWQSTTSVGLLRTFSAVDLLWHLLRTGCFAAFRDENDWISFISPPVWASLGPSFSFT